jgi:site-specific recombinase XerD
MSRLDDVDRVEAALLQWIDQFREYLQVANRPLTTIRAYSVALRQFQVFAQDRDLTVDVAIDFAQQLHVAPVAKTNYLAAVSRFYRFLIARGMLEISNRDWERFREFRHDLGRHGARTPHPPSEEDVQTLLQRALADHVKPSKSPHVQRRRELAHLRDVALLESLRASGMRVGELVSMDRDGLDAQNRSARIVGKGSKERTVYFDTRAWTAIEQYLLLRADEGYHSGTPVFVRHNRGADSLQRLGTRSVQRLFDHLVPDLRRQRRFTPHSLRHSFATRALEATGNLAVVQDLMGHSSPITTRIYAQVSNRQLREAHRKAFGD